jgi:DNA-binding MarR family transcriptional regulator
MGDPCVFKHQAARNEALARAYLQHGYTLVEIDREAELHYATASRIIKAMEEMS